MFGMMLVPYLTGAGFFTSQRRTETLATRYLVSNLVHYLDSSDSNLYLREF